MKVPLYKTVINYISESKKELLQFIKSLGFSRAVRTGVAVATPLILGIQFGFVEMGIAISFGAFWSSPSDVIGNFRHKKHGILFSAALVMVFYF